MNTPAHLVLGLAAFGRPGRPALILAALAGAALPDASLYVLAGWELARGTPARVVFDELYWSDLWQSVFAVDNSIPLFGALLVAGLAARSGVLVAFSGAALLHLGTDFALHHDDARRHLWPLSDWVFASPVSYWDPAHFGRIAAPVEAAATMALCILIWRRHSSRMLRAFVVALAAAQLAPTLIWAAMLG